ncbi:hypothetical protein PspLS_04395 [Pyricularia sp. CBS 133598]|nr:hypothetical protein PspLS_04395 [Pyricularia sp. CBS 133598]
MLRTAQRSINRWSNSAWHLPCALSTARRGLATTQPRQGTIHKLVFAAVTDIQDDMAAGKRKWELIRSPEIVSLARDHPMVGKKLRDLNSVSVKENSEWRQTDAYRGLMEILDQRFRLLGPEGAKEDQLTEESPSMNENHHPAACDESSAAKTEVKDKIERDHSDSEMVVESREQHVPPTNEAGAAEEPLDTTTSSSKHKPDSELVRVFAESRGPARPRKVPEAGEAKVTDKRLSGVKWMNLDPDETSVDDVDDVDNPGIEQGEPAQQSPEEPRVKLEETYQNALYLISLLPTNSGAKSEFLNGNQRNAAPDEVHRRRDILNRIGMREITKLRGRAGLGGGGALNLKSPDHRTRYIHIAGTKGKGTVAHYITSILTSPVGLGAGKIGTYTSPHINTVRERIKIDGEMLSEEEFTKHFFRFWRVLRRNESREKDLPKDLFIPNTWMKGYDKTLHGPQRKIAVRSAPLKNLYAQEEVAAATRMPFLFNFMTLLAMRVFQAMRVKTAVVECGIGAEYDTTNILIPPSDVSVGVVTAIDYEHTSMLGKSLPEIAWHKTGVFKPGASAVVVRPPISATTYDFMHGMTQGAYGLPKPPSSSSAVEMEELAGAPEQADPNQAEGNAVMGVIWGRAIDRGVKKLVDVPFDVGIPYKSAPPDEIHVGGPIEKLNMAVASLAVSEHFHQIQASRTKASKIIRNVSDTSPSDEPPLTVNPYQPRVRSLSLTPYLSRGRWQAMIKPTHLAAMAFAKPLPGRREIYQSLHDQETTIYLDGAHTANSLRAVGQWFQDKVAEAGKNNPAAPLAAIIFDQRDRDRDPIALLSALIEPLRSSGGIFNEHTLAYIGIIRPRSGGNEAFDDLQLHFESEYPWLRFMNFEHVDHATFKAASKARKAAGESIVGWWPRPVHVLFTGSFSLTSRPSMRDPVPVLFNMPSEKQQQHQQKKKKKKELGDDDDDPASRVDDVLAALLRDVEKRDRAPSSRGEALRKRRMAIKNQQARIRAAGDFSL